MKTLYEQLGVTPQASLNAIQQSFFRLARKFDPDNPANQSSADAHAQYRAVHDAYRTLSDSAARRRYDLSLQTQSRLRTPRTGVGVIAGKS
jgi:DnaJ-class molecular chaperone